MKDLIKALQDVDYRVRLKAVEDLGKKWSKETSLYLIDALGDLDERVHEKAAKILKTHRKEAHEELIGALKHTSWAVRRNAATVLASFGAQSLEVLLDQAKSNNDDIQFWITEILPQFGTGSLKTLVSLLESEKMPGKLCAISALGKTRVKGAVKPLLQCLHQQEWTIRKTAAQALIQLGQLAVEEVLKLLKHESEEIQFWAIQILGEIGGGKARKALIQKLQLDSTPVDQKQTIIQSMKNADSIDVIEPLIQMLGDANWFVRKVAAQTLWEIGDLCLEALGKALKSQNTDIRYWSAKVLGELQARGKVTQLTELMKNDPSWSVRSAAAQALGEIGAEEATLDLIDALRDSSEFVKKNAVVALNQIGETKQARENLSDAWVQDFTRKVFSDLRSSRSRGMSSRIRDLIEDVPDFPKPGIVFKDISPLLVAPNGLNDTTRLFASMIKDQRIDCIAGIESRGFILGSALAQHLRLGFVAIRKKGKLPGAVHEVSYALEYGESTLEIQKNIVKGLNVLIVDDVLATGGTAKAVATLVEKAGGYVHSFLFLIELDFLNGREKLEPYSLDSILHY